MPTTIAPMKSQNMVSRFSSSVGFLNIAEASMSPKQADNIADYKGNAGITQGGSAK